MDNKTEVGGAKTLALEVVSRALKTSFEADVQILQIKDLTLTNRSMCPDSHTNSAVVRVEIIIKIPKRSILITCRSDVYVSQKEETSYKYWIWTSARVSLDNRSFNKPVKPMDNFWKLKEFGFETTVPNQDNGVRSKEFRPGKMKMPHLSSQITL